ncbi:MAG: hypothetical protein Q9214_003779 [Letrouitia sp. 1 TL-2023]
MDPLSTLVGVYIGASGTLVLQALTSRFTHQDSNSSLVQMSKKTKLAQQMGFVILKGVTKTGQFFDAFSIPPSFPDPIPATQTSLLPTAEPSGIIQPLPSSNPTIKPSLPSTHSISLSSVIMMVFLLVLITSLAAIFFVACFSRQVSRQKRATLSPVEAPKFSSQLPGIDPDKETSTKSTLITGLKTRIAELEIQLTRQTVQNVELSRRLEEHAPGDKPALSVEYVGAISISPAPEIEPQEPYESLSEQSVDGQETSNRLYQTTTEEERPKDWIHPRKARNMRRGGPNKGRHAPKKPEQDLELVVGESKEIDVEAIKAGGDNETVETEPVAAQPTNQGPTGKRPGHRARYRAKKRERKAAEEAALLESSSNDHQS